MAKLGKNGKKLGEELRKQGLAYPETHEDHPWGEIALKVKGKVFTFMHIGESSLSCSFKLPASAGFALKHAFAEPTHYGLGKHGWVSCSFEPKDDVPMDLLKAWMNESFHAVAPKMVLKRMHAGDEAPAKAAPAAKRKKKKKLKVAKKKNTRVN